MGTDKESKKTATEAKDLLLEDYRYLAESFWKNEQTGETRVNLFIGIVTAVVAGMSSLITSKNGLAGEPLRLAVLAALVALLVLGIITLFRMLTRNENTDGYKQGLDSVRQAFKDHFDGDGLLTHHYSVGGPEAKTEKKGGEQESGKERRDFWQQYKKGMRPRKFGGLAHTVAAINSLLLAAIAGAAAYPIQIPVSAATAQPSLWPVYWYGVIALVVSFLVQLAYLAQREMGAKNGLAAKSPTHAGGAVYRLENGAVQYLLVSPSKIPGEDKRPEEWVLPKGHIEPGEGHGEAALRELREEAGVIARVVSVIDTVEFETAKESVRAKFYLLEYVDEVAAGEKRHCRWLPLEDALTGPIPPESKYVLRAADRRRATLALLSGA